MKDKILELRDKGYSYNQIVEELSCSKGTVAYHCGEGQKEKTRDRVRTRRSRHSAIQKLERFRGSNYKTYDYVYKDTRTGLKTNFKDKIRRFCKDSDDLFSYEEFIEWLEEKPTCYLTGREIDLSNPRLYHFDHIIPRSKGGSSEISNLGLACAAANQAKSNLELDEFIDLCVAVLLNFGVIKERDQVLDD